MRNVTKWHILLIGLVIFGFAVVYLWFGFSYANTIFDKVLTIIACVLLIFISSIFFILFAYSFGESHNVFLYDYKKKTYLILEELTYEKICEFIDAYLSIVYHGVKCVGVTDAFKSELLKEVSQEYHSLIHLRILIIWIEMDSNDKWNKFALVDRVDIDVMEEALLNCGEYKISSKIHYLWSSYSGDDTNIKEFFCNNLEYLREFLLNYIKENIHLFD